MVAIGYVRWVSDGKPPFVSPYKESEQKLVGYSYLGGVEKAGGRRFEGYWLKDDVVYYVNSGAYGVIYSIDELFPQPDIISFRVNYDDNPSTVKDALFAYDSERLYYLSKALDNISPAGFQYIEQEVSHEIVERYEFFKSGDIIYKIKLFCSDCEPILVSEN
jgi:hypothetical protein